MVGATQSNYVAAEQLYRRSLAIRESSLGKYNPTVASLLNNLAVLLEHQVRNLLLGPCGTAA